METDVGPLNWSATSWADVVEPLPYKMQMGHPYSGGFNIMILKDADVATIFQCVEGTRSVRVSVCVYIAWHWWINSYPPDAAYIGVSESG